MNIKSLGFIALGVVLLGGLFVVFKPQQQQAPILQPTTITNVSTPTPVSNKKTFMLKVMDKKLVSGQETLTVTQGDEVVITILSDEDEEFHIHGYDKSVDLIKDQEVTLTFVADISGRFTFELEESKTEIGVLEVQPK